jgi:nucleotide-binding universal stress UspA family protein
MSTKKKILFPTDFSIAADAGLPEAEALAKARGAALLVLHVQEPMLAYDGAFYYGPLNPTSEMLDKMLHQIVPADKAITVEHRRAVGDPASEIVRTANEEHADIIVMGTHGRRGLSRLLMGSVAESVIRHAPCPVLTYKTPKRVAPPSPALSAV